MKTWIRSGYTKRAAAVVVGLLCVMAGAQQKVLKVAAAADLRPAMPAFAQAYEKKTGVKLDVSFASSSVLATQILNGAPFDVFLSADFSFAEKVVAGGLAVESMAVPYAQGTLVLWARKDSPLQPVSMSRLTDPRVTRVAVADQFHAPYGFAAYSALTWLKLMDKVGSKLVVAENVGQAAQFVESGNAQIGFISLTQAMSPHLKEIGEYNRVPEMAYTKLRQCAVVMKKSPNAKEGVEFLDWMRSQEVQEHLKDFGMEPVL